MKRRVLFFLVMGLFSALGASSPRDPLWRQVDDAMAKGLPRSAIDALKPIVDGAIADQAWAEAAKAMGRRIALESQIEGRAAGSAVTRLAEETERAPAALKPIFHTLLANAYWAYFRQNQWRFAQRTATATPPGNDFTSWDLRRLFAEIDRNFELALSQDAPLKATPIGDFNVLLTQATVPDALRPTLYDFLVHQALEFYQAGEQGLARPEDAFTLSDDSPALGTLDTFLRWQPATATTDTNAPTLKAVLLYQALLRHHATAPDRTAWLNADLDRLVFAHRAAKGPDKDERFINSLLDVADRWAEHELSARARQLAARTRQSQGKLSEAHRLARQATEAFPQSFWTRDSRNLIAEIEAPQLAIETEHAWNPPWPTLDVEYRNLTKVWFRAVKVDWAQFLDRRFPRPERLNRRQRLDLLARPPALEWSADLPPTRDFRQKRQSLPAPNQLAPGYYFIFASHQAGFPDTANELSVATVWVSQLALLTRSTPGAIEGFVVDAQTGEPLPGATIEAWFLANNGNRSLVPASTTDASGLFRITQGSRDRGHLIRATFGDQQIAYASDFWWQGAGEPDDSGRSDESLILTDRALYRPGQTVYFKGIAFRLDPARVRYELRRNRELIVVFRDANQQEVARRSVQTSDLGSFSGNFTAPTDRLPGQMFLAVEGESGAPATFNVEEYKRPKFQVILDPPKDSPRLNETVVATGRALTYTGAPVDRAKLTWHVRRETQFPSPWSFYRSMPHPGDSQEIAHGSAETAADGSFQVRFRAHADPSVPESDEPTFSFQWHVDITDASGETRSADRSLRVGFTALEARLSANPWQQVGEPVSIQITTQTLDQQPVVTAGTIRIHRLEEPSVMHRPRLNPHPISPFDPAARETLGVDLSRPADWKLAEVVAEQTFQTTTNGPVTHRFNLPAGIYRAVAETVDRFGKRVLARLPVHVLDPGADKLKVKVPSLFEVQDAELEPGEEFVGLWGTGYESGRALVEIRHRDRLLQRFWTQPGRTQQSFRMPVTEELRGGFSVSVSQVRENRLYPSTRAIRVPWLHKKLELTWETFRSKLEPGQNETWSIRIRPTRPGTAEAEAALRTGTELAAVLYDASLDQFLAHDWPDSFPFWPDFAYLSAPSLRFSNEETSFQVFQALERRRAEVFRVQYRAFPPDLRFEFGGRYAMMRTLTGIDGDRPAPAMLNDEAVTFEVADMAVASMAVGGAAGKAQLKGVAETSATPPTPPSPKDASLNRVAPRRNLNETGFFFPHLTSDSNGVVRVRFTVPEALTEWRFFGFAHDRDLRSGALTASTITAKDVMVQPNPPRFLREGDELVFTAKIVNASDRTQAGRVRLQFSFAQDSQSADTFVGNTQPELAFEIPARESRAYGWKIRPPDGCGFLTYKIVAAADQHSDGEEGFLPVLSRRVLVTESLPLPLRGPATKTFEFASLRKSGDSPTLRHQSFRVEVASNPAWFAVLALPYLMEYPHECAEQTFNRLYANALAQHVAQSDPRIRKVFDLWRGTSTLESPLEKNQDLKAIALAETPWIREARSETEQRRNIGILFDPNRLASETERALKQLAELQLPDGAWPWFAGGPRNDFVSLYIIAGFGRLRQLGVTLPLEIPLRAVGRLDAWAQERYEQLKEQKRLDGRHLDPSLAFYLYSRSFFLADQPVPPASQEALRYWLSQARDHWQSLDRQSQAHVAIACDTFAKANLPEAAGIAEAITRSLKERSVVSEEMGRFWREDEPGWWWYRAPIETQSLMIELFRGIGRDPVAADECRMWLLKQKQTQHWKSTKATADAVYALLLGGPSLLGDTSLVALDLGGLDVTPRPGAALPPNASSPEPGTGYYQVHVPVSQINPELATLTLQKSSPGVAWGAAHWQYFEELSRIAPYAGTPLVLSKKLFTRVRTRRGAELKPVAGPLAVGDELVVRIDLKVDRDVEFVHLKDARGSGTEPVQVLSGYRFQDGLGYYETTRDTASHFFIDYLPRGSYVFEYSLRVQHKGAYPSGVAEIQCLYAPEFNSHSESIPIQVR